MLFCKVRSTLWSRSGDGALDLSPSLSVRHVLTGPPHLHTQWNFKGEPQPGHIPNCNSFDRIKMYIDFSLFKHVCNSLDYHSVVDDFSNCM